MSNKNEKSKISRSSETDPVEALKKAQNAKSKLLPGNIEMGWVESLSTQHVLEQLGNLPGIKI